MTAWNTRGDKVIMWGRPYDKWAHNLYTCGRVRQKKMMGTSCSSYLQVIRHSAGHSTIYRGCPIPMFDYQRAMGSSWGWNQHIAGWMATRGKSVIILLLYLRILPPLYLGCLVDTVGLNQHISIIWLLGLDNHICRSKLPFLLDGTLLPVTAVAGRRQPRRWCQAVASTNSRCARTKEAQGAKATGCHQTWLTVKSPINGGLYTWEHL